jgi:hypothetical protein
MGVALLKDKADTYSGAWVPVGATWVPPTQTDKTAQLSLLQAVWHRMTTRVKRLTSRWMSCARA